ncbi:MAG: carboxylesterase family protein, partial [Bryobacterales bacterium]|nr:carboxylesterase family protein [Bryobacterales bacterium]
FHKAAVQSGSMLKAGSMENSAKAAAAIVEELGLNSSTIDRIQTVSYEKLWGAVEAAEAKSNGGRRPAFGAGFALAPAVDGKILPSDPFAPEAPAISAQVPMLIGTVLNEASLSAFNPKLETMTDDELKQRVSETQGDKAGHIIEIFQKTYPDAKPVEIAGLVASVRTRSTAIEQATRKAAQRSAPAYLYLFAWHTPVLDARPRAFHCSELAFVFDNTDRCSHMTGGGREARELGAKVSEAWIRFARTGNPNHPGLPHWPVFTAVSVPTMVFNTRCEVQNDHDGAARQVAT